jgi:hypothetical protein
MLQASVDPPLFATEEEAQYFDEAEFDAPLPEYYLRQIESADNSNSDCVS